jgi:hypothetical protein
LDQEQLVIETAKSETNPEILAFVLPVLKALRDRENQSRLWLTNKGVRQTPMEHFQSGDGAVSQDWGKLVLTLTIFDHRGVYFLATGRALRCQGLFRISLYHQQLLLGPFQLQVCLEWGEKIQALTDHFLSRCVWRFRCFGVGAGHKQDCWSQECRKR